MPEYVMDLITGERKPYNPAPPQQDDSGMEGLNPRGVDQLFREQPVDVALKAVEAAIQFQGMRGYQQALKDGQPAEKAMARFGPMIFRKTPQAMGPAVRSLTPPVARPTSALDQARIDEIKRKGTIPPKADVRNAGGGLFQINPDGTVTERVGRPTTSPYQELNFKAKQLDAEERSLMRKYPGPMAVTISPEDKAALADIQKRRQGLQPPMIAPPGGTKEAQSAFDEGARRATNARTTTPPTAAAQIPFKEGQRVRNKKNGKLYEIRNGEPVEVKE